MSLTATAKKTGQRLDRNGHRNISRAGLAEQRKRIGQAANRQMADERRAERIPATLLEDPQAGEKIPAIHG